MTGVANRCTATDFGNCTGLQFAHHRGMTQSRTSQKRWDVTRAAAFGGVTAAVALLSGCEMTAEPLPPAPTESGPYRHCLAYEAAKFVACMQSAKPTPPPKATPTR